MKDGQYILEIMIAKRKGEPRAKWKEVSSAAWKEGGWATEAAALAARTQFKQWVDTGMNAKKRAAQAESAAARSPAGLASLLRPPAPTRASGRRRAPDNCQIEVAFKVCGGNLVKVELAFVATLRSSSIDMNTLWLYRKRSAAAHERAAKRARGSAGDVCWDDLVARCRVAATARVAAPGSSSTRRVRPRGATIANRVGKQKRRRPDRHVQRREQQAVRLKARVKEAKAFRAAQIQKLRGALWNNDAASFLCQPEGSAAEISQRQAARATTQCWVVLKTYEEIDRIEEEVLTSGAPVPRSGIAVAAAEGAAAYFGIDAETARAWRFEFEQNAGKFELDGRGKWERELLIHEADLARKFHKWMVATARDEKLSVEAAREYLNGTLLHPPHVTEEMLLDYHIRLPVSNSTAHFWMTKCGAQCGKFAQSYYNDHHESEMVIKDRRERYIPDIERDERRAPLWVQLTLIDYEALREATIKAHGELPGGYRYQTADGISMVELHVDDSNHFEAFRASHPLGGDFSVQWEGRPRSPPSAPPGKLPDPGVDIAPVEEVAPAPADAAVGVTVLDAATVGAQPLPPGPLLMTAGAIRVLKVAEAREACKERGLSEAGLKPELIARLLSHRTLAIEKQAIEQRAGYVEAAAAVVDDGGGDEDGSEADESYDVKTIHSMRRTAAGAIEFEVEWEGWLDKNGNPERTWEHEANLDGCEDKLAAFFSDPEHRCGGCHYGHRREVCRCHLPLWGEGQDEAIFKPFVYSSKQWKINGVSSTRKKTEGTGKMTSASVGELRGFGFPMTREELAKVNELRAARKRPPLSCSPGLRFLDYGKNKEGYWDFEMFKEQTIDFMDAFEALHPDWQLEWEVDWSSGHAKYREGALNVNSMGVKYGGKQKTPRESKIPSDPVEADFYLGPHDAKMKVGAQELDCKLKPGDTQSFYFQVCNNLPLALPPVDLTAASSLVNCIGGRPAAIL